MTKIPHYGFRAATMADLALLRYWLHMPHVGRWWGHDDPFDKDDLADPRVSRWIVLLGDQPFAYLQDYAVHGWDQHHFAHLPPASRGIDQFIGEAGMIGKGHGKGLIRQRMQELFQTGVPVLAADPSPENHRAITVYQRLGFVIAGQPFATEWGMVLPMEARRPEIGQNHSATVR